MDKSKNFATVQFEERYEGVTHTLELEIRQNHEGKGARVFIRSLTTGEQITDFEVPRVDADSIMLGVRSAHFEHLIRRTKVNECIEQFKAIA